MHIPVLKEEVVDLLNVEKNKNFIDCTAGEGGHIKEILKKNAPSGRVLALEWDKEMYERLKDKNLERTILINESYTLLERVVEENDFRDVSGILLDLGMSSWHIKESGRGFSFLKDDPLDMRYDQDILLTAEEVVNKWREKEIEKIINDYSQERFSKEITKAIIANRPIKSSKELADIIREAVPENYERGRIDPATRTFQAIRIVVNLELENLKEALPKAEKILEKGGRLAVISFHSLEDEIVKDFLNSNLKVVTKKAITPSREEIRKNPSSRSAKLRVGYKL